VEFVPIWGSIDGSVTYLTGSKFKISPFRASNSSAAQTSFVVKVIGLKPDIRSGETLTLRVNLFDQLSPLVTATRIPIETPGIVVRDAHYSLRNADTGEIVIPFDTTRNSTRLSSDVKGMWFTLESSGLPIDQRYVIDIKTVSNGVETLYPNASPTFRVTQVG
jgi:hypothetical protein